MKNEETNKKGYYIKATLRRETVFFLKTINNWVSKKEDATQFFNKGFVFKNLRLGGQEVVFDQEIKYEIVF